MKTEHTPEPWKSIEEQFHDEVMNFIGDKDGGTIGEIYTENDARRIVACVNACAGISTENLEDDKPPIELAMAYNVALRQRDELLAALEQIVAANPRKWEELAEPQSEFERWAKSRANHAIASVKEKQNAAD